MTIILQVPQINLSSAQFTVIDESNHSLKFLKEHFAQLQSCNQKLTQQLQKYAYSPRTAKKNTQADLTQISFLLSNLIKENQDLKQQQLLKSQITSQDIEINAQSIKLHIEDSYNVQAATLHYRIQGDCDKLIQERQRLTEQMISQEAKIKNLEQQLKSKSNQKIENKNQYQIKIKQGLLSLLDE
ncbi:hypothetical protein SS50377_28219 [Spironucleus salmonicida]|uniref:Uncharacterized protein n=1 Tax=Spironucleus salmonicida TaxID=348837 RepID=V6LUU4_9EUKA|nr:hypothetical protein SS50377_28219 [Spironucleus salmonicida]|eukprot:EST48402.1 Hypothetical protein SS50377_11350 [Spironucleus salmonicida]